MAVIVERPFTFLLFEIHEHCAGRYRLNDGFVACCSLESTKSAILPELVELANDEESSVRLAGLDTVVSVLSLLDEGKNYTLDVIKYCI